MALTPAYGKIIDRHESRRVRRVTGLLTLLSDAIISIFRFRANTIPSLPPRTSLSDFFQLYQLRK